VVSRNNYASLAELPDLAQALGVDGLTLIPVDDHCGEHLSLRKADLARYNAEIGPRIAERALALGLMRNEAEAYPFGRLPGELAQARAGRYALGWYERHPCFAPWTHSLVDFSGRVYICCMTREQIPALGNVRHSSFKEIWEGPGYAQIRRMMHPPALPMCARCDDFLVENRRWEEIARQAPADDGRPKTREDEGSLA
jgi:MoaA/NifB/PqqE/SkfB family radical SAM enzyme